jgi:3-deoxy-manno-octulosonate cytidylyltransferase (CMP-KDO synthetase)
MATAAHAFTDIEDFRNSNVVKVVLDRAQLAMYFSRAPIAWWRDGFANGIHTLPEPAPLRHIGIYAYRVGFLHTFPTLTQAPVEILEGLEQLRALWHGYRIAVHTSAQAPGPGVDTAQDLERVRKLFLAPPASL